MQTKGGNGGEGEGREMAGIPHHMTGWGVGVWAGWPVSCHVHTQGHLQMVNIPFTRGQLDGGTRAVFNSCITILPEGQ